MSDEQRARDAIQAILKDDDNDKVAAIVELLKQQRTEILAMLILTQTLMVDKNLVTREELDRYVNEDNINRVAESIGRLLDGTLADAVVNGKPTPGNVQ